MALRPGFYAPPKLPEPHYVDEAAKTHAERLKRDFKAKLKSAQAQPIKRTPLL